MATGWPARIGQRTGEKYRKQEGGDRSTPHLSEVGECAMFGPASLLVRACVSGDLGAVRAALAAVVDGDGNASGEANTAFCEACVNGHLDVARWLFDNVPGLDVHARHDAAFRNASMYGHLTIARWLHDDVGGVDVDYYADLWFQRVCRNGHVDVARWLHDHVGGVDAHADDDQAFTFACSHGQLDVARWLHEHVGGVSVHAYDQAFIWACNHDWRQVALWLDSDEVWFGRGGSGASTPFPQRAKPAKCVEYVQNLRWSELRQEWMGIVAYRAGSPSTKYCRKGPSSGW